MRVASTATVLAVEWVLLGLCLALIVARLHLRLFLQHKQLILSDYLICLAWLSGTWQAAADIAVMRLGFLKASTTWFDPQTDTNNLSSIQKVVFMAWIPLLLTQYLNKFALLTFLFNIIPTQIRSFYLLLWTVTIFSGLSYIASILTLFLICVPIRGNRSNFWFCGIQKQLNFFTITWVLHFASDIMIFILPLFIFRTLHLDWKKKLGLYATFGFGLVSISAALVRFIVVFQTFPSVHTTTLELWCAIDSYVGTMAACLPSLRPYLNLENFTTRQVHNARNAVIGSCSHPSSMPIPGGNSV
ncbi:uncharacterized protein BJX67DRAFT_354949 [Aspergillus lucknowensis]|uniref:Rhodopsin domain-containing protein n=1 Tax=Aspergillus lucknowensis TaxID=176173 RepID=A0ABR4LPP0_9EURO